MQPLQISTGAVATTVVTLILAMFGSSAWMINRTDDAVDRIQDRMDQRIDRIEDRLPTMVEQTVGLAVGPVVERAVEQAVGPAVEQAVERSIAALPVPIRVARTSVVVHTTEQQFPGDNRPKFIAPNVPASAARYLLDLGCPDGYTPLDAWPRVSASHPALDVMYTIDAGVDGSQIFLDARAREQRSGYAYVDVVALCVRGR